MAITALPPASIRILGAGQSIVDPVAVVKELVENALDANATSIVIEIARNCMEVIQVRDNGYGIPPADRHLVAKRHCTSKIASESELRSIGGRYLGFRGEALSHLAAMSSALIVTTRVEGESAGSQLSFSQDGTLTNEQRKSLAVGTTVRVVDFLATTPVRKQILTKSPQNVVSRIRTLLQRIAFARSHVRLAFSVLQKKTGNADWLYAPSTDFSIKETAGKVVGKASADECQFAECKRGDVEIQALLPKQGADLAKMRNKGEYIVLDGRPLRPDGVTGRKLLKQIKKHHGWQTMFKDHDTNVFICLAISCQKSDYDAAVDPGKDDVLFGNIDIVLNVLSALLDTVYPTTSHNINPSIAVDDSTNTTIPGPRINLDPVSTFLNSMSEECKVSTPASELRTVGHKPENADQMTDTRLPDKIAYNPWSMAKLNAPRKNDRSAFGEASPLVEEASAPPWPTSDFMRSQQRPCRIAEHAIGLPTPVQSSPIRGGDILGSEERSLAPQPLLPAQSYLSATPLSSQHAALQPFSSPGQIRIPWQATPPSHIERQRQVHISSSLASPRPQLKRSRQTNGAVNKPFKKPAVRRPDPERDAWFHFPETPRGVPHNRRLQKSSTSIIPDDGPVSQVKSKDIRSLLTPPSTNGPFGSRGLQLPIQPVPLSTPAASLPTLQYEAHGGDPLRAAAHTGRENLLSPSVDKIRRRTLSDHTALAELSTNAQDPRDFLLRPRTKSGRKKRAKSSMMPLERSLPGDRVYNLQHTVYLSLLVLDVMTETYSAGFVEEFTVPLACYRALEGFKRKEVVRTAEKLNQILTKVSGLEVEVNMLVVLSKALL